MLEKFVLLLLYPFEQGARATELSQLSNGWEIRFAEFTTPASQLEASCARGRDTSKNTDPKAVVSPSAKHLVEAFDVVVQSWAQCKWPEPTTYKQVTTIILKTICDCALTYAKQLHEKLRLQGYCDEQGQFDISHPLCVALNNLCAVIECAQSIPAKLGWNQDQSSLEKNQFTEANESVEPRLPDSVAVVRTSVPNDLVKIHQEGLSELNRVLGRIFERITAKAINDLIVYLESNFETLRDHVSSGLLKRCFMELWSECLEQFLEQVHKEAEVGADVSGPGAYLNPQNETVTENKCVIPLATHFAETPTATQPSDINPEIILRAKSTLLKLKQSLELLVQFFIKISEGQLDRSELENETFRETSSSTVHGTLTVNLYIQQSQLVVEVLSASGLEPLDSNGLSDPFVVVELMPKHVFSSNPKPVRTKIIKNNLDPVFNEQFEL
ncbi:hypothetical protein EG68_01334 [Paragonimus skrjabini miyazakii]|uniref:C2 domain-containing protein n=1 Tax=Paragonimus skrjabini miyazakii TaxID=59628 RepID=A0A8S9ZC20_9TREM|nr:hypothetical protein EG68_01334 [Paragonimus skrjabini miyazakii]